ncbi:MAG: hypothetical protein V4607_12220 [Pseudomonadota bacterium]
MSESFPITILWLIAGLAIGTGGGYFWGVDSQLITDPTPQYSTAGVAPSYQEQSANSVTSASVAIPNPTGLRLVGTLVQPERSKSKAWLLQVNSETTQTYAEGDALPGGYQLTAIGAEDLQVTKDGKTFVIRRVSSSSGQNAHLPCEAIAQNAQQVLPPNKFRRPSLADRIGGNTRSGNSARMNSGRESGDRESGDRGIAGRTRHLETGEETKQAAQTQGKAHKPFKGWGNKTFIDEEAVIDDSDALPTDKDSDPDTKH